MVSGETILAGEASLGAEEAAVREIFGLDPTQLGSSDLEEYNGLVTIVGQFSRVNQATGLLEVISPSRIAAIPAITARHCELMRPARGDLSTEDVMHAWRTNMPVNDGTRHPDALFDVAQYNFGTDEPLDYIVSSLTRAEQRRRQLVERYKSTVRQAIKKYSYEMNINDDAPEEQIADFAESLV